MRIFHFADPHFEKDKQDKCNASADFIVAKAVEKKPSLILNSGDTFNRLQSLNSKSAVTSAKRFIMRLAGVAPVVIIKGNEAHDSAGCLEIFDHLDTLHPVYTTERAESIWLASDGKFVTQRPDNPSALLHLLSYPEKSWFLAGKESLSIDETNQLLNDALRKIFIGFGSLSIGEECPVILVGHCNVQGAVLSTGQLLIGQDIMVSKHDLELVGADYYALGHIHKAQEVGPNMYYSGSTYHCNFGETEKKQFNLIDIDRHGQEFFTIDEVEIPSVPLALLDVYYEQRDEWKHLQASGEWGGAETRIRLHVTKEQGDLISDDELKAFFSGAHSYQIERIIIPEERVRAAQIVTAKTLPEKVKEWGSVIDKEIPLEVLEMAGEVERSAVL